MATFIKVDHSCLRSWGGNHGRSACSLVDSQEGIPWALGANAGRPKGTFFPYVFLGMGIPAAGADDFVAGFFPMITVLAT